MAHTNRGEGESFLTKEGLYLLLWAWPGIGGRREGSYCTVETARGRRTSERSRGAGGTGCLGSADWLGKVSRKCWLVGRRRGWGWAQDTCVRTSLPLTQSVSVCYGGMGVSGLHKRGRGGWNSQVIRPLRRVEACLLLTPPLLSHCCAF